MPTFNISLAIYQRARGLTSLLAVAITVWFANATTFPVRPIDRQGLKQEGKAGCAQNTQLCMTDTKGRVLISNL